MQSTKKSFKKRIYKIYKQFLPHSMRIPENYNIFLLLQQSINVILANNNIL